MSAVPTSPREKVALGRQLFFDKRLSADGTRSCYSCHVCEHGLTDGKPVAEGALGKVLTRSSPSLWNIAYHTEFYWDGRSPSLERQAMAAWTGGNMGANAATLEEAVDIMLEGGIDNPYIDSENLKKVELTGEERAKLIELLRTLPAI